MFKQFSLNFPARFYNNLVPVLNRNQPQDQQSPLENVNQYARLVDGDDDNDEEQAVGIVRLNLSESDLGRPKMSPLCFLLAC